MLQCLRLCASSHCRHSCFQGAKTSAATSMSCPEAIKPCGYHSSHRRRIHSSQRRSYKTCMQEPRFVRGPTASRACTRECATGFVHGARPSPQNRLFSTQVIFFEILKFVAAVTRCTPWTVTVSDTLFVWVGIKRFKKVTKRLEKVYSHH